jgi:hypothetical protein
VQDGRIYIEKINGPFLFELKGTPAEYKAGLDCAIAKGWLELHLCPLHRRRCSTVRLKLRPFDRGTKPRLADSDSALPAPVQTTQLEPGDRPCQGDRAAPIQPPCSGPFCASGIGRGR